MKKYLFLTLLFLLTACDKGDDAGGENPIISADFIRVSPNLQLLGDGQVEELSIEANCNWTITKTQDWLTVSPTSGSNSQRVKVSAGKNSTGAQRTDVLTIRGGNVERYVMVTQAKGQEEQTIVTPELAIDVSALDFGELAANETKTVTVTNKGTGLLTVNIRSDNALFTVSPAQLTDIATGQSKTFNVTFNYSSLTTSYGDKSASITVTPTYEGGTAMTIRATAIAKEPDTSSETVEPGKDDNQPPT